MNEIFPWCVTIGILGIMVGLLVGLHVASTIYSQWVKKVKIRLKNINENDETKSQTRKHLQEGTRK